jgi:hypothetical protein
LTACCVFSSFLFCSSFLSSGQIKNALAEGLQNPPDNSKDDNIKAINARPIVAALKATAKKDVKALVAGLNADQADICMKHVFKAMEGQENTDVLLEWHAQLFEQFGIACIVRAINEKSPVPEGPL